MIDLYHGDCREILPRLPANFFHGLLTDPPAAVSCLENTWDIADRHTFGVAGREGEQDLKVKKGFEVLPRYASADPVAYARFIAVVFTMVLRILRPGAHGLVWSTPRMAHHVTGALERVGFEIRDILVHIFGDRMPKGDNLKPAVDFWILIRKPLAEATIKRNAEVWGTGLLQVKECLIEEGPTRTGGSLEKRRRPANLVLSGDGIAAAAALHPGAPRFFFAAKASPQERRVEGDAHPTCKPLSLMRHFLQLLTPRGGSIVDPFLGSGTTAVAAAQLGLDCTGIEQDLKYLEMARQRIFFA